ncbi:MAG TPA: hypothetical protein VI072_15375 [Polyangiaceae bacterium]
MSVALLSCADLRIDVDGAALIDGLSCAAEQDQVGLVGAWEPLFLYLTGRAELAGGSCQLLGMDARDAVQSGAAGVACHDPPLPPQWSALEYVQRSAELAGVSASHARASAQSCLSDLGVDNLAARRLSSLTPAERRVLGIVQATATRPAALVLDAPLADLDEPGQELVAYVLQRAAAERRLLCSARRIPAAGSERGLIDALQQVLILENGRLLAAGSPSELFGKSAVYRVSAIGGGALFRGELERRGCRVFSLSLGQVGGDGESSRLLVRLPDGTSADAILDAALAAEAGIIEMIPVQAAQADLDALGAS